MSDLVEFLTARLDEDERIARAAIPGPWAVERNGEVYAPGLDRTVRLAGGRSTTEHLYVTNDSEGLSPAVNESEAAHIARHDPARVLADVAAKRAIVELHSGAHECSTYDHNGEIDSCTWVPDGECTTVLLLAQPFADHPDFDLAWKVET